MRKIIKLLNGPFIPSLNMQLPIASLTYNLYNPINLSNFPSTPSLPNRNFYEPGSFKWRFENTKLAGKMEADLKKSNLEFSERFSNPLSLSNNKTSFFQSKTGQALTQAGIDAISSSLASKFSNEVLGDSELGRGLGTLFSSGVSSAGNTISNNIIKGKALTEGLGKNAGASLAGAGAGLAANYIGLGINALGGDSMLSRGIGQGVATGLGTLGGTLASNLVSGAGSKLAFGGTGLFSDMSKMKGAINPYALGATVLGSALGASMGPSKEYAGKYGNITQTMDTAYDLVTAGVNFVPGIGQGLSAAMVLNKGLSNIFGSTDGMTKTDAILGSAFMPAPVKWLNMWGSSKTGTFNNQSWLNSEKANSFMGDAFGNLNDRFDQARTEAGKTYGTFSQGAKRRAQENIDFANYAWNKILNMADLNEIQNIRSLAMSSINNLRYALMIQGGFKPLAIGKRGMKIFNNATNHNIGMRLLSGAALIDNKQMILCNVPD